MIDPREGIDAVMDVGIRGDRTARIGRHPDPCLLSGDRGTLDENEALLPAVRSAQERGVIMDAAMGDYGFSWAAAAQILGDGIAPDTVSSDFELHAGDGAASGLMVEDRRGGSALIVVSRPPGTSVRFGHV